MLADPNDLRESSVGMAISKICNLNLVDINYCEICNELEINCYCYRCGLCFEQQSVCDCSCEICSKHPANCICEELPDAVKNFMGLHKIMTELWLEDYDPYYESRAGQWLEKSEDGYAWVRDQILDHNKPARISKTNDQLSLFDDVTDKMF